MSAKLKVQMFAFSVELVEPKPQSSLSPFTSGVTFKQIPVVNMYKVDVRTTSKDLSLLGIL